MLLMFVSIFLFAAQDLPPKTYDYHDEASGITYRLPVGYTIVRRNAESPRMKDAGQRILLIADKETGRPLKNRIVLSLDTPEGYTQPRIDLERYSQQVLRINSKRPGVKIVREIQTVRLNGRVFYRGDYTEQFPEATLYKVLVCSQLNGYWLSWTFVGTHPSELEEAIQSVSTINGLKQSIAPKSKS